MRALLSLLLILTFLSGCSDGPGRSIEGGHDHGAYHTCPDGTVIDPGDYGDHHGDGFDADSKCPAANEPARVTLRVEDDATAFQSVTLWWDVTPAGDATTVSTSQVRASRNSSTPDLPDAYGEVVAEVASQEAPVEFMQEWTPLDEGTFFLRAHATIAGTLVWSDEVRVEVAQVQPTGVVHDVTINTGTAEPELSPTQVEAVVGDAVQWVNADPALSYTVSSADGPTSFNAGTVGPGAASNEVVFLDVGTWTYTVTDSLGRTATGSVTVAPT